MRGSASGARRILIVEDEPNISQICKRVLISEGFEADVAANGAVAQEMMGNKDYELILVDIRTPVMNGRDFYTYLKERYPELVERVVFTTGDVIGGGTKKFLQQSGRPFLSKPFTPDELKDITRDTLRQLEK